MTITIIITDCIQTENCDLKGGKKKKTAASAIQQRFVIDELLLAILFFPLLLSIDVAVYFVV